MKTYTKQIAMRKMHPSEYEAWLQSMSDRELMGLYLTHCSETEEPCDKITELAQAIWFEAFDRGLA